MREPRIVDVGRAEDQSTQDTIREQEQEGWVHYDTQPQGNGRYLAYFRRAQEND
jgi:hypothetical protein